MKTLLGLFLLFGMSPGSFLPSFLTDQLLAPVLNLGTKAGEQADETAPAQSDDPSEPKDAQLVAMSYAAIRSTGFQVAKDQLRSIFTLKIQAIARFVQGVSASHPLSLPALARFLDTNFQIAQPPAEILPQIQAQAPPQLA